MYAMRLLAMAREAEGRGDLTEASHLRRIAALEKEALAKANGDDDGGGDTDDVPEPKKKKAKKTKAKKKMLSRHDASPLVLSSRDTPQSASYFARVFGGSETVEQVLDDRTAARMSTVKREKQERASMHLGVSDEVRRSLADAKLYGTDAALADAKAKCAAAKARALAKVRTSQGGAW